MRILQRCLLLLYSGIGAGVYILWHYRSRKRLIKNWMQGYSPVEKSSIPRIYKRISQYLPVFLLIEYLFSKLSGQRPSSGFRQKSTALAALTPLLDDLNDEYNYDAATIKKILLPGFIAQHDEAALCRLFFGKGGFEWDAYWDKVLEIQDKSRLQSGTESIDLNQITREKGGASVVLGWSAITNQYGGEKMAELSLHFGAFAQLLNDIFDIWKDREAGVRTPATSALDIAVLKTTCNDWATALLLSLENVEAQSFAKKQIRVLLDLLIALGHLALEQLYGLQQQSGGIFILQQYSRKELVCDMAKWPNRLRWAYLVIASNIFLKKNF